MTREWTVRSSVPGRLRARHPIVALASAAGDGIRLRLLRVKGVSRYSYNPATSSILVRYDAHAISLEELLHALGTIVENDRELLEGNGNGDHDNHREERRFSLSTANVGLSYAAKRFPLIPLRTLAIAGTAGLGLQLWLGALHAIFIEKRVRVDILDAVVVAMLLANQWVLSAAIMVWILDLGDAVLESASRSSRELIANLFGEQRRVVSLLRDGEEIEYAVADLDKGDVIVVRTGEQIPVDGVVRSGEALVDQHVLSGEHAPVDRGEGETVFGMTSVLEGRLIVEVRETAETSSAARIVQVIERTMQHRVRLQYVSERFADRMVVPTLGIGGLGYALAGRQAMIAIINADFGTGIRVACPLALVASLSFAARNGIVIRNGKVLETLRTIDAVVFDKTGTLTQDVPEVTAIHAYCDFSENEVLAYAACAERKYAHPIAKAILREAAARELALPRVNESTYRVGFGLQVDLDGQSLKVGSLRFMDQAGVAIPNAVHTDLRAVATAGRSAILVALGHELVGMIELRSVARDEARGLITRLKQRHHIREIALLSGDHYAATKAVADHLGIDRFEAEVLPENKARYVRALQEKGWTVAMVGDGINDSMALAGADCSISLRGAADVAMDVADVVFMDGGLGKFDLLFDISEKLNANVRRSFAMAIVPNTVLILGALGGWFGIGSSMILNNAFNMAAAMNGLLPYWQAAGREEPAGRRLLTDENG
jgi:Cu2+-exporting ATPase